MWQIVLPSKQRASKHSGRYPALPLLPNFCLQKEAAENTFCIFSCSIFTALCLLWKKWPYSCAKHVTAPKGQPVLFPSKAALKPGNGWVGCSGWWLGWTSPTQGQVKSWKVCTGSTSKLEISHKKYHSEYFIFLFSPPPAFVFRDPPRPIQPVLKDNFSLCGLWRLLEKLQLARKGSHPVFAALPFLGFAELQSSCRLHTNLN